MGKSSGQVTGYRYFTNFLLFIGNPIEKLLNINFDKRGWIANERISYGSNGEMIYIENINLYGENEGGVAGTMRVKHGTNNQTASTQYKKHMASLGLPASAYPCQSYIVFGGGGFSRGSWDLTEEELEVVGDDLDASNKYLEDGFYVGNSGYMKEMLLWPKRIHVRNDGRAQWYKPKAGIPDIYIDGGGGYQPNLNIKVKYTGFDFNIPVEKTYNALNQQAWNNTWSIAGMVDSNYAKNYPYQVSQSWIIDYSSGGAIFIEFTVNIMNNDPNAKADIHLNISGDIQVISITDLDGDVPPTYGVGQFKTVRAALLPKPNGKVIITVNGSLDAGLVSWHKGYLKWADPVEGEDWIEEMDATDINPIHKIREILTDDTAMNKPESSVNSDNFIKAADRIWDERLGISWAITEKSCIDAINELCYHIEAGIRINRQTGLYEMVLFRDDWFDEDEIHTISESKIKSMQYEITNADEVINQVNVNYYDRANIKNSSFSISESGLIQTLGRVNAETVDFPYFMNIRNAEIVANWKLKVLSTGVYKGTFTTGWREARKWNRYDLIRLPWSKRWVGTILVRIMSINLGGPTNNEVSIEFVEVVPSTGMMNTTIVADELIEKPLPPQSCQYEPFEMPYYLAVMALGQRKIDEELAYENNFGLVGVVAEKPQSNSLYAVMMTNNYDEWIRAGSIQYSLTTDSDQFISKTSSSFTVKNWKKISNVPVGTLIQCGREWLTGFVEWMVFQGVDPHTGVVSVKRGALDTQPQDWDLGLKLYFCGTDVAYDATEYVAGEKVLVSALTTTPSGVIELKGSNLVEMKARAIRPYPPANVKINGEYWPEEIETDLVLTWVDRNRLQQTGGSILGWFEGGVTIEPNTQTHLVLSQLNENNIELATSNANVTGSTSYTMPIYVMQASTRKVRVTLKTVRDGYECLNPFVHIIELSKFFSAPYDLTVEFKND